MAPRVRFLMLIMLMSSGLFPGQGFPLSRDSNTKRECAICHVTWIDSLREVPGASGEDGWKPVPIRETLGVVSREDMCYSCHDGFVRDSRRRVWEGKGHSVGKVPSPEVRLPETFPLDTEGKVYCGTCHTPHGVGEQTAELTGSVFLRVENVDSQLCKTCHTKKLESPGRVNHPVDVLNRRAIPRKVFLLGGKLGSDPKRVICQSCHTPHGKGTLIAPVRDSSLCFICHADKRNSGALLARGRPLHPVHVRPPDSMVDEVMGFVDSRPGSRLGARGQIECLSCHGMHRGRGQSLVLRFGGEDLCSSCHRDVLERVAGTKHDLRKTAPKARNRLGQRPGYSGVCGSCHLAHGWAPEGATNRDTISELCLRCHNEKGVARRTTVGTYTHPVDRPPRRLPETSPLKLASSGGQKVVTCSTCHDPHAYAPDPEQPIPPLEEDGNALNSFLRMAGPDLCRQCHPDQYSVEATEHDLRREEVRCTKETRLRVQRDGVCSGCHRVHQARNRYLWVRAPYSSPEIGKQLCGGCHAEARCGREKKIFRFNHPVGVSLSEEMEGPLPLYDRGGRQGGKVVTCFSCHDAHKWAAGTGGEDRPEERFGEGGPLNSFLRLPNDSKATLCLACHRDKQFVARTDHDMRFSGTETGPQETLPATASVCSGCHRPHSNEERNQLWVEGLYGNGSRGQRACLACHRKGGRAEKKAPRTMHPLSRSENPEDALLLEVILKGQVIGLPVSMNCRSCHDPHRWGPGETGTRPDTSGVEGDGSNSFLRMPTLPDGRLCVNCHRDKVSIIRTKHDMRLYTKQKGRLDEEMTQRLEKGGVCAACHEVHDARGERYLWALDLGAGEGLAEKMCFSCHSKGHSAADEIPHRYAHPKVLLKPAIQKSRIPATLAGALTRAMVHEDDDSVTCFTCHNSHRWEAGVEVPWEGEGFNESARNKFLRVKNEDHICKICHGLEGLYRYLYFHQWDRIARKR